MIKFTDEERKFIDTYSDLINSGKLEELADKFQSYSPSSVNRFKILFLLSYLLWGPKQFYLKIWIKGKSRSKYHNPKDKRHGFELGVRIPSTNKTLVLVSFRGTVPPERAKFLIKDPLSKHIIRNVGKSYPDVMEEVFNKLDQEED